jgi:hypothetical protein
MHKWGRRGMRIGYWWQSQKERELGRPRHRLVDNIKMDLRWDGMAWIVLIQDRAEWRPLVDTVLNLYVP